MSLLLPPARYDDYGFPDGWFFARLTGLEYLGEGSRARSSLDFDAVEDVGSPEKLGDWIATAAGPREHFGLVRIVTTQGRFADMVGAAPDVGRWYRLRLGPQAAESRAWTWFARLQVDGFTSLSGGRFIDGEPLASPDDGDLPPGPKSLGAAASPRPKLPSAIALACQMPASGCGPDPEGVLQSVDRAAKVCVRDVGQASFVTMVSDIGECLLHFDVGSPVAFNRRTLPPTPGSSLADPRSGPAAPVIVSHWDWDHIHAGLQVSALRERPWIAPDQPLGPTAARLAHHLAGSNRLAIWPGGTVHFPWGTLGSCSGSGSLGHQLING